jgi:TRAP-type transport system small permease protein
LSRALKLLDRTLFVMIGMILAAMVIDVTIQIVFRYIVQDPPTWTEELARYLFAWEIFLATALAFGRGSHIVVDIVTMAVPKAVRRPMQILSSLLVLAFLLLLVRYGIAMVEMTSNTQSVALALNMGFVYASLPTGAAISALYVLARLVDVLRGVEVIDITTVVD